MELLLLFALLFFILGFATTAKFLLIIAVVLLILGLAGSSRL